MIVAPKKYEHGKYYLAYYRGVEGTKLSIFKYKGLYSEIKWAITNSYRGGTVKLDLNCNSTMGNVLQTITFELDEDEVYRHITMELITSNL